MPAVTLRMCCMQSGYCGVSRNSAEHPGWAAVPGRLVQWRNISSSGRERQGHSAAEYKHETFCRQCDICTGEMTKTAYSPGPKQPTYGPRQDPKRSIATSKMAHGLKRPITHITLHIIRLGYRCLGEKSDWSVFDWRLVEEWSILSISKIYQLCWSGQFWFSSHFGLALAPFLGVQQKNNLLKFFAIFKQLLGILMREQKTKETLAPNDKFATKKHKSQELTYIMTQICKKIHLDTYILFA